MDRKYLNVELSHVDADRFRGFLLDNGIKYESSGAWNLVHFECLMNEDEAQLASEFLETTYELR